MYTLFDKLTSVDSGKLLITDLNYIRAGLQREIRKVVGFYQRHVQSVASNHLLVRLIQSLPLQLHYSYDRYIDVARDAGFRIANSLQLTSPLHYGLYRTESVFYGENVHEIIIATDEEFDIPKAILDWRNLEPVKVLSHPYDDFSLAPCDGKYPNPAQGLSVITVNIPMLMLMYRRWYEVEKTYSGDANKTLMQFVRMYPLTNMLYSHTDHCFFNRLNNIYNNRPVSDVRSHHPFNVLDYSMRIDGVCRRIQGRLDSRVYDFGDIVKNIPMISHERLWDIVRLPKGVINRQVVWAYSLARVRLIGFLLSVNLSSNSFKNRDYVNRIKIDMMKLKNDNALYSRLPESVVDQIEADIELSILAVL